MLIGRCDIATYKFIESNKFRGGNLLKVLAHLKTPYRFNFNLKI